MAFSAQSGDPWSFAMHSLASKKGKSRLKVPVIDTIIFSSPPPGKSQPVRWIFMGKDGYVSRKKEDSISWKRIRDRFTKLASQQQSSVCTVHMRDGSSHALDKSSFLTLIAGAERDGGLSSVAALQPFVSSRGGGASTAYRTEYRPHQKKTQPKVWRVVAGEMVPSRVSNINQEVSTLTAAVARHLESQKGVRVSKVVIDYILDRRDCLWLSGLPEVILESREMPAAHESGPSRRASRSIATPESSTDGVSFPMLTGAKCRGDFCGLVPSTADTIHVFDHLSPKPVSGDWRAELQALKLRAKKMGTLKRGGDFKAVANRSLMLARGEMEFIMGVTLRGKPKVLAKKWSETDARLQREMGANAPMKYYEKVNVCPCCYDVYMKIERLRSSKFMVAKRSRPRSGETKSQAKGQEKQQRLPSAPSQMQEFHKAEAKAEKNAAANDKVHFEAAAKRSAKTQRASAENDDLKRKNQKLSRQLSEIRSKLAESQQEWLRAMKEKDDACRRSILQAESKMHDEIAAIRLSSNGESTEGSANVHLVKAIEELTKKLASTQTTALREKSELELQHRKALQTAEKTFQERLAKHEEAHDASQDKALALQTQMYELMNDVSVSKSREEELRRKIATLEENNDELETELSIAKQAAKTIASGSGSTSAQASAQVSASAQVRKMANEVQFMRQQLANEVRCKGELTDTVSMLNDQLKRTRREAEKAFSAQADENKRSIRELEERHREEIELPRSEVLHLEDKMQNLQVSLTNMAKDVAMARRKERAAQQEAQRMGESRQQLIEEKDKLEKQIDELQSTLEISEKGASVAGAERATTEAHIRQLQNEIEYLKSQLLLEKSHKEELDAAIERGKHELIDAKESLKTELAAKDRELKKSQSEAASKEAALRDESILSTAELKNAKQQLANVTTTHSKTRDEYRAAKDELMKRQQELSHAKADLAAALEDLERERDAMSEAAEAHQKSMSAMQATLRDLQYKQKDERELMDVKLSAAHSKISSTQADLIAYRDKMVDAADLNARQMACIKLHGHVERMKKLGVARAFGTWRLGAAVNAIKGVAINSQAFALKDLKERLRLEKETACARVQSAMASAHEQKLEAAEKAAARRLADCSAMALEDTAASRRRGFSAVEDAGKARLREMREMHEKEIVSIEETHQGMLKQLEMASRSDLQAAVTQAREENKEALERCRAEAAKEKKSAVERIKRSHEKKILAISAKFEKMAADAETHAKTEKEAALAAFMETSKADTGEALRQLEEEKAAELQALRAVHEADMKDAERAAAEAKERALNEQATRHKGVLCEALDAARKEAESEMIAAAKAASDELQASHGDLVRKNKEDVAAILKAHRLELERMEDKSARKLEEELEKARIEANQSRANALKHANAKWQRVLSECTDEALGEKAAAVRKSELLAEKKLEQVRKEHEEASKKASLKAADDKKLRIRQTEEAARKHLEAERVKWEEKAEADALKRLDALTLKHENSMVKLEAAKQRALTLQSKQAEEAMKTALESARRERDDALLQAGDRHEKILAETAARMSDERTSTMAALQERAAKELQDLKDGLNAYWTERLEGAKSEGDSSLMTALEELQTECEKIRVSEINDLKAAHEEQVEKLRSAIGELGVRLRKREQDELEARDLLQDSEDMAYDLQTALEKTRKMGGMQRLAVWIWQLRAASVFAKQKQKIETSFKTSAEKRAKRHAGEVKTLQKQITKADTLMEEYEKMRFAMRDCLVNHKREALMEHKVNSTVLQSDLAKLADKRESVESLRASVAVEIAGLQGQVKDLESQMIALSKVSAIQDGKINVSHAKRKRRLDREFEHLLEQSAERQDKLERIERELQSVDDDVKSKEDELKALESSLVGILVGQQKELLHTLSLAEKAAKKAGRG